MWSGLLLYSTDHLRPDFALRIYTEQRVVYRIAMIARDERRGPDRVQYL